MGLVAALAVAGLGVANVRADPTPDLPPIAGDELLASTLGALARPFTIAGDVDTHVDLGIPQIPASVSGGSGGGIMGAVNLVAGDQRYKIWRSPDGVRVAHLLPFAEQDVVVNQHDAWFWDSSDMSAIHLAGVPGTTLWDASAPAAAVRDADLLLVRATGARRGGAVRGRDRRRHRDRGRPSGVPTRPDADVDADARRPHRRRDRCRDPAAAAAPGVPARERRRGHRGRLHERLVRPDRSVDVRVHAASRRHGAPGGRRHRGRSAPRGRSGQRRRCPSRACSDRGSICGSRSGWTRRSRPRRGRSFPTPARCCRRSPSNVHGQAWLLVGPVSVATLEQDAASLP